MAEILTATLDPLYQVNCWGFSQQLFVSVACSRFQLV